ncbi:site-specific DNA-methyltransferase [Roseibacillus persicicus]|uniref:site-specific DNA-methyltransferase (adenine-specific) n=1 Tax=Roseibacillus persicicus TaxID=454148 RepID=A0A918WES9_9BACT|nr:site-specific DNA-methyltransferase [Roseibacillus persicicus]GHC41199.1 site-specific DNA-methyltransferase [Roseibacillus persicicus]
MNKLKLHSKDLTMENIEKLAELFPNCMTETLTEDGSVKSGIDFDLLRQELSADLVEGPQERYRLDWPGKREALATANAPIAKTLRPCREESMDFESTENLYIEGDNLDALKLLQETYLGKVKMIYIDPPYNTGNDFIYDDNYSMTREDYRELSGDVDEDGNQMFDEEKWQQNSSARGRYHSEWLSMMYPRLKLARNLLREDGVIFISIDDNEIANLRRVSDEVFGAENFIANIIWQKKYSTKSDSRHISESHDHIVVYGKRSEKVFLNGLPRTEKQLSIYKNPDNDSRGRWTSDNLLRTEAREYAIFPIKSPKTNEEFLPPDGSSWRYNRDKIDELISDNRIWFGVEGTSRPRLKRFLSEVQSAVTPQTFWSFEDVGHSDQAKKELGRLFDGPSFSTPKPVALLQRIALIGANPNDIILDFFSGSATSAHAVMKLNAEDGGSRRHIQVQLPEPCDEKSAAFKAGYATIAEIGKERIRRAGAKIREELTAQLEGELPGSEKHNEITAKLAQLDTGFRVLKVDSSNMTGDYYKRPDQTTQDGLDLAVENIKPDRSPEDLLFQVMLDWGVDLALPITRETIAGKEVFFVAPGNGQNEDAALAACFEAGLGDDFSKALAKKHPLRAVFRDASFADDAARINVEQLFKTLSPHTEVRAI